MDGVDAAVVETDGRYILGFGPNVYRPYTEAERATLRDALGLWDGPRVKFATQVVENAHREVLSQFGDIDLIGFHGQTLAHDPGGKGTLQVGDGAALANDLGIPVVWDFRSEDIRQGGQGAPLAPFFHFACAQMFGADKPLAFLNLGGVGNLTWLDPGQSNPEAPGALLAFDTGPANAPVDDLVKRRLGWRFDKDGDLARQGDVQDGVLEQFLGEAYFFREAPKSLDRDAFREMVALVDDLPDADAVATLTAMCAASVVVGIDLCPRAPSRLLVTGGGRKNKVLMEMLAAGLTCPVETVETVGLDGDMLEAQAFAFLAARVAAGLPTSCASTTGVHRPVSGGIVSAPEALV